MVFKPFTHLARQSIAKSFTHGYAQTFVAASQSSYVPSSTSFSPFGHHATTRFGKANTPHSSNIFTSNSDATGAGTKAGPQGSADHADGGLAAYYVAWQQQQQLQDANAENEWKQFQFTRRIEWRAPPPVEDVKGKGKAAVEIGGGNDTRKELAENRETSASGGSGAKNIERDTSSKDADETVLRSPAADHALASSSDFTSSSTNVVEGAPAIDGLGLPAVNTERSTSLVSESPASVLSPGDDTTAATSISGSQLREYDDQIAKLYANEQYKEIPAVFEVMIHAGVTPTVDTYNSLLLAGINLPVAGHQTVSRSLNIYADMHRRGVSPNSTTYSTLIELVASRALLVSKMKRSLEDRRARYGGMHGARKNILAANDAEYEILAEDNSYGLALRFFDMSRAGPVEPVFPLSTYKIFTALCAEYGNTNSMTSAYVHMETQGITRSTDIFTSMIIGFARSGRLDCAIECYNEYKNLAIAANAGQQSVIDRIDEQVYAALIQAYVLCGNLEGANRFYRKIQSSYTDTPDGQGKAQLAYLEDLVIPKAFVQDALSRGLFHDALHLIETSSMSLFARHEAMTRLCIASADQGEVEIAVKAYGQLGHSTSGKSHAAISMMALYLRLGDVDSAISYWNTLQAAEVDLSTTFVEPATMYFTGLLGVGRVRETIGLARKVFDQVRSASSEADSQASAVEAIDESIEAMGRFMREKGIVPSASASMDLMWSMIENGGLVTSVTEQLLAGLGRDSINQLCFEDLVLALQVQAGVILNGPNAPDLPSLTRFAYLLEAIVANGVQPDKRTTGLVDEVLGKSGSHDFWYGQGDLMRRWQRYQLPVIQRATKLDQYTPLESLTPPSPVSTFSDSMDPYSASIDHRASSFIADELERGTNKSGGSRLDHALIALKNIRRSGRHPRYATYAKLISAAAREGRFGLTQELLGMARADIPYLPHYQTVKQGWVSILDAMVGACLTLGNRDRALQYHLELSGMGATPSANTFGLYITTLKESTKTFDEATEAVKIFRRAMTEGVEPSSFLYNALIGKLGKARRIDECLFYFHEMRQLGIHPTSVTYGTIVNALCRVSDEKYAESLFEEMEGMPNYKPRPAPYNSLMQFFLTTKRDRSKVLHYYERMTSKKIPSTSHTFKLLIDSYATLEPIDMTSAEGVLGKIHETGQRPEAVHYASLIHARGCSLRDLEGARKIFQKVISDGSVRPQACLYQAFFEAMVANHNLSETEDVLHDMGRRGVAMTPYIANTLIHGWALSNHLEKAKAIFDSVGRAKREPSTYEAMTRAFLATGQRESALGVVREMSSRGYPSAVAMKIQELVGPRNTSSDNRVLFSGHNGTTQDFLELST